MHVFVFESLVMTLAFYALMAVKVWAFVDALIRPAAGYVAAEKLTKPAWLLILGLTVVTSLLWRSPLGLFSIVGTVAAFVYILDAKPAIASITRRTDARGRPGRALAGRGLRSDSDASGSAGHGRLSSL